MHLMFSPISKDSRPHFSGEKCVLQVLIIVQNLSSFKNSIKIYVKSLELLDSFLIVKKKYWKDMKYEKIIIL